MPAGRPSKLEPQIVELLAHAFEDGATIEEACVVAQIDRQTYYNWIKDHEDFSARMESARNWTTEVARSNLAKRIKRGDVPVSQWWLERKAKNEFSTRNELSGPEGKDLVFNITRGNRS